MATRYIAGQMIDLTDDRLSFALAGADEYGATIAAQLRVDIGGGQIVVVGDRHMERIDNSTAGRRTLLDYPAQVQGWLIPGIWGDQPTVTFEYEAR